MTAKLKSAPQIQRPKLPPANTRCQEASVLSRDRYIPCGQPAVRLIWSKDTPPDKRIAYAMCGACADHSVRNRGLKLVQVDEQYALATTGNAIWDKVTRGDAPPPAPGDNSAPMGQDLPEMEDAADVTDAQLISAASLARLMMETEDEIERIEAVLRRKQDELEVLAKQQVPAAMKLIGMAEIHLVGGTKVILRDIVSGSITKAGRPAAHAYLRSEGAGPLIKTTLGLAFGMGEEPILKHVLEAIGKIKQVTIVEDVKVGRKTVKKKRVVKVSLDPTVEEFVAPPTLGKWIRERKARNAPIDPPMVEARDRKGKPVFDDKGKRVLVPAITVFEETVAKVERPDGNNIETEGM